MTLLKAVNDYYYATVMNELRRAGRGGIMTKMSYNNLLYLDLIEMTPDCTVSKLAEILRVSKSAVTIRVGELLKLGLVTKEKSPEDGRVHYLRLNSEAVEDYRAYDNWLAGAMAAVEKSFTPGEVETFCTVLDAIRRAFIEGSTEVNHE
ncbi:MAG: MarR family transcriptional regulator [Planctomycetaceae bacterium]|nr:MarR family transcriptional regulator [Planctomycetaceae bacterium]